MTDHEVLGNAAAFRDALGPCYAENTAAILKHSTKAVDEAYVRMVTLQAWRSFVLEGKLDAGALGFYSEAQNDGLTSVALMCGGLWRPAMISLRSLMENVVKCLYYMDHPVEYRRWEAGAYKPTISSLFQYLDDHPDVLSLPEAINPLNGLRGQYRKLSEAVHASAIKSRMTDDIKQTQLWRTDKKYIGQWSYAHRGVVRDANLLLLGLFKEALAGAAVKGLKESLASSIPASKDKLIKEHLGVRIAR